MWRVIGQAIVIFMAVYGAVDVLCRITYRWCFSGIHDGYFVVPLPTDGCVEYAVRHGKLLCRFLPRGDVRIVVVANEEPTDIDRMLCERLQVELVTAEEWKKMQETTLQPEEKGV